jgi:hypothetical protein
MGRTHEQTFGGKLLNSLPQRGSTNVPLRSQLALDKPISWAQDTFEDCLTQQCGYWHGQEIWLLQLKR